MVAAFLEKAAETIKAAQKNILLITYGWK